MILKGKIKDTSFSLGTETIQIREKINNVQLGHLNVPVGRRRGAPVLGCQAHGGSGSPLPDLSAPASPAGGCGNGLEKRTILGAGPVGATNAMPVLSQTRAYFGTSEGALRSTEDPHPEHLQNRDRQIWGQRPGVALKHTE